jgi:uncharacterized repeat protein (TIGR01451 family)
VPWPGGSSVATADGVNAFGGNVSGLKYEPSGTSARGVIWAVRNSPSLLYRLVHDGTIWTPDVPGGWGSGKALRYPSGLGNPDAEGVTLVHDDPANGIYVAVERDGGGTTRPSIERYDPSSPGPLTATHDWDLTADLPGLPDNRGPETIEWIPDAFLVSKGFVDDLGVLYDPANYPNHGTGLFFVGVEQNGTIYAYALNHTTSSVQRVATILSGHARVMGLDFEPVTGRLWAVCDNDCIGEMTTLDIAQAGVNDGRFVETNRYARPTGMADLNNEGFAIAPQRECAGGTKPAFWADDDNTDTGDGQHVLREGTLSCIVATTNDLSVSLQGRPSPLPVGGQLTYKVRMRNEGPVPATGVTARLVLAASETFVSATSACTHTTGVVRCTIPRELAVGAGASPSVTVTQGTAGLISTTATVSGHLPDAVPANDSSTERTVVQ